MASIGERIDISGTRFGYLIAVRFAYRRQYPSGQYQTIWECLCDCGKTTFTSIGQLRQKRIFSCGCKSSEMIAKKKTTHGHAKRLSLKKRNKTYAAWINMRARCFNEKSARYGSYGARGITVCDRWLKFENFLNDLGEAPVGFTLERINVNGNYEPNNCKWIPSKEQFNNMQKSLIADLDGESHSLKEWSRISGLNYMTLYDRFKRGDRGAALFRKVK